MSGRKDGDVARAKLEELMPMFSYVVGRLQAEVLPHLRWREETAKNIWQAACAEVQAHVKNLVRLHKLAGNVYEFSFKPQRQWHLVASKKDNDISLSLPNIIEPTKFSARSRCGPKAKSGEMLPTRRGGCTGKIGERWARGLVREKYPAHERPMLRATRVGGASESRVDLR